MRFVILGVMITSLLVLTCVRLGNWQYHKAQIKQQYQAQLDQRLTAPAVPLPEDLSQAESLRYLRVKVQGEYIADAQFLLDNQVYQDRAGYHVYTPLRVQNSQQVILVNRGWTVKDFNLSQVASVPVPTGVQTLEGYLWLPPSKQYRLNTLVASAPDKAVRQILDIQQLSQQLGAPVVPAVLRLIQAPAGSDLIVDWPRPDDRIVTHLGYAYQWYGFAAAAVLIFLVVAWRRRWKS
jgi:surfeit locus 1 family protein